MSLTSRLFNVFAVPGEVFDHVRRAPPSVANWVVPALLAIALGWASALLIFSQPAIKQQLSEMSDQAIEKQIQKMKLPPERAEEARAAAAKYGDIGQKTSMLAAPVVWAFVSPFFWGFLIWLGGAKVFKGGFTFMKAVEVAGLANMIGALETVVKTLLIMLMGTIWAAPHLGMLMKDFDPQKPLHAVLAALNVMTFWLLAVRALGMARLANIGFAKAAAWIFGIWLIMTSLMLGVGFALQAAFSR
jgi:hypothetical protein